MANPEQLSTEEIDQQQALLATYRRTLAHLLQQAARHGGEVATPPAIGNAVYDARASIRRIKATLRAHGAPVTDHPDDELPPDGSVAPPASMHHPIASHEQQGSVSTGGGDYTESNVDKRQGAFVSGGTIYGPVVGTNAGTITTTYGSLASAGRPPETLEQALAYVQQAAGHAQQRGEADLADDLSGVALLLLAAIKAQHEHKAERRAAKLHEARAALKQIASEHPDLQQAVRMLE